MAKGTKLTAQAKKDLARTHRLLMSGDERHFKSARKLIATYTKQGVDAFNAPDLFDRVKRWIENADMEVKEAKFLEDMVKHARDSSFMIAEDARDTAIAARALRYGGRFNLARKRYNKAVLRLGDLNEMTQDKAEVLADFAEFWAYLGYTDNARAILARIPAKWLTGWLLWVQAFVQHQAAFTDQYPIGTPVRNSLGSIPHYLDANLLLARARIGLNDKERADSYLLEAANWGGVLRRLKEEGASKEECDAAKGEAECALAAFGAGAQVNQFWTWKKERRGMMVARWVKNIDEPWLGKDEVREWRRNLVDHYKQNLKAAGLKLQLDAPPPNPVHGDGENGKETDPGDDDE